MYNFLIVLAMIIFLFFISADPKVSKEIIKKSSLHIILFLLLVYFIYNNLHLGFLLLIILGLVLYYTSFKNVIWKNMSNNYNPFEGNKSLNLWADVFSNFSFDKVMDIFSEEVVGNSEDYEINSNVEYDNQQTKEILDDKKDTEAEMLNHLMTELEKEIES